MLLSIFGIPILIISILYLIPFTLAIPACFIWFIYLIHKIRESKKFYRNAIKYSSEYSAYYDSQVVYHYRTEHIKYILLFVILLTESLVAIFYIIDLILVYELRHSSYNTTYTIKPCIEIYKTYNKYNEAQILNIIFLSDYNADRLWPFALSDSLSSFSIVCIVFLCDYIITRHYRRPEMLRKAKFFFLSFSLFLVVLAVLGCIPHTAIIQMLLYILQCYILYIVVIRKMRNLNRMLKQKYLEAESQAYSYRVSNELMWQYKRYRLFSFVLLFGLFFIISGNVLNYLEILTYTFLYTGKCWFSVLYGIDYHPLLADEHINILRKVDYAKIVLSNTFGLIASYSIGVPFLLVSYAMIFRMVLNRFKIKSHVRTHFRNPILEKHSKFLQD